MPKSASDVVGRIGKTQEQKKWNMLGALVINNSAQLSVTVAVGLVSLFYVWEDYFSCSMWLLAFVTLLFILVLFVLFVFNEWLIEQVGKYVNKLFNSLKVIKEYSVTTIVGIFLLSAVRYVSFSFSLVYVLWSLGLDLSFLVVMVPISLIYLTKAIIPGFNFLADLGVKQYSHVYFLAFLSVSSSDALVAGLIIWLAHTFLPSLIGLVFIWKK